MKTQESHQERCREEKNRTIGKNLGIWPGIDQGSDVINGKGPSQYPWGCLRPEAVCVCMGAFGGESNSQGTVDS